MTTIVRSKKAIYNEMLDDEDFYLKRKRSRKATRETFLSELNGYRKTDKNVKSYEKLYYQLTGRKLKDMDKDQINDLIIFIISCKINNESKTEE